MQTEDPPKATAGRSKPVSSSVNTPGSRVHLGDCSYAIFLSACGQSIKCFLCFGFSRALPSVRHSASLCLWFLSDQMLSKYLHNWEFGLFLFSLPLHPLLGFLLSKQIFIATCVIKAMPAQWRLMIRGRWESRGYEMSEIRWTPNREPLRQNTKIMLELVYQVWLCQNDWFALILSVTSVSEGLIPRADLSVI